MQKARIMRKAGAMRTWIMGLVAMLGVLPALPAAAGTTLYEDLGSRPGVTRIIDGALALYLTDPRLHSYFDNINPAWLKPRFVDFVCKVAGGPCIYRGRSMAASHKGLHVDEAAFYAVVEDLQAAMRRAGIPFRTQNRLLARLAPMERDIVTR